MKITERRLRSIIRSVIKEEQRLDEAMDMMYAGTPYEAGPSGTLKDILNETCVSEEQIKDALEALRLGSSVAGMLLMLSAQGIGGFLLGAAISVGACVFIIIDEYKKRAKASEKRKLREAQNSVMRDCDSCEDDVRYYLKYYTKR